MIGIDVEHAKSRFHSNLGVDRTAEILVERLGSDAFEFATRQAELLADTGTAASVEHWRRVAHAIEALLLETVARRSD